MPSDAVVTRREIRSVDYVKRSVTTLTANYGPPHKHLQINPWFDGIPIPPGWEQGHSLQELEAATHLNAKRQAVSTKLSPKAAALIKQLQTAQYALELCNSDFNLTEICQELRDPKSVIPLANVSIDSSQASDIVCFASMYGIDLKRTNAALLGDLAAAVYGLELGDNFTATTNTTKLCNNIDLTAASLLGIDAGSVNNFICGIPSTNVTVTSTATQTTIVIPGSPTVTFTASSVSTGGGFGGPNSTFTPSTASGSIVSAGTAFSETPTATGVGTAGPYGLPISLIPSSTAGVSIISAGTSFSVSLTTLLPFPPATVVAIVSAGTAFAGAPGGFPPVAG
jgi:hypothetical protein